MCGRYTTNTEEELIEIKDILNEISIRISDEGKMYLGKEVTPSCIVPIITSNDKIILQSIKWGLPKWDNSGLIFNCKSETMNTSRFFAPIIKNRCVIPAKCYYEWTHENKKAKDKYKIDNTSNMIFFVGVMNIEENSSFTIITKKADNNIEWIHNRMPVIIDKENIIPWLEGKIDISMLVNNSVAVNANKM